jgi:hypothetical protein
MNELFKGQGGDTFPVECLGRTFASEQARRDHYSKLLAEKLKDPEFRKIEGFPVGTDEAILAMSDPPYYTACPNPFVAEFVERHGEPYDASSGYSREPLAIDVQVGKTDALYKAHGYHTKVPHLAIVPSILHYTNPGDIVLDGFSGSGMTGVAAQWCESASASYRAQLESEWRSAGRAAPRWGARRVVLNDLSPAATFISTNYTLPFDLEAFARAGKRLLDEMSTELGWMYETLHTDGKTKGCIEYTVWSEVFSCPSCAGEVVFLDEALDQATKRVRDSFPCPHCSVELTKRGLDRLHEMSLDQAIGETIQTIKRRPALIVYEVAGKRFEKKPDANDFAVLAKIAALPLPQEVPRQAFPFDDMWETPRLKEKGITHTHQLFLPRPAHALALAWQKAMSLPDIRQRNMLLFFVEQAIWGMSLLNRYTPTHFSHVNQYLTGAYYVGSQHAECSPWYVLEGKLKRLLTTFKKSRIGAGDTVVTTGSAASLPLPDSSIDYIFTDPPFGDNLPYAELNFLVESWHRLFSQAKQDAIVDRSKQNKLAQKSVGDYRRLMSACFSEYYRVLKPGHWMTVVFSNTQAAVWNSLQTALQEAGFVVANVSALDKMQGSFKSVTTTVAVKQDLVISAYKPNGGLEARFAVAHGSEDSAWDFVRTHLKYLPTVKLRGGQLEFVAERDPRIIFDRLVAWFVRHSFPIPLSSQEFQAGLAQRFTERDGMIFLPEQAAEYDKKRLQTARAPQMEMFVSDERSAIDWLSDFLKKKPSTYQEIHPEFIRQLGGGWKKHEAKPELSTLLEANFLQFEANGQKGQQIPPQIHSYLSSNWAELRNLGKDDPRLKAKADDRWYVPDPNKARDLEMVREKALLKEFDSYQAFNGRRLKEFRLEVLRAGFKTAWAAKNYKLIIAVAQKIPEEALQEDEKLLLWYDQALTRTEADA